MKNSATSKPKEPPKAAGNSAPWTSWIAGDGSHSFDDSVQQPSPAQVRRAGFTRRRGSSSSRSTVKDGPSNASKDDRHAPDEKKRDFYRRRTSTLATQGSTHLDASEHCGERPSATASDPGPRASPENPKVLRKGSSSFDQFFTRSVTSRPSWLVNRKLSKRITSDRDSDESRSTRSRSGSQLALFDVALDEAYAASTARDLPEIDDGFEMATFDVAALTDVSERPVGVGCQGTVWSCQVPEGKFSGRRLALKVLRGDLAEDETECQSFVREALLLGRMKHAHVLRALGCAETSAGLPCLLLAWVETDATRALRLDEVGGSATARAEVKRAWPSLERLRLLRELALALEFLHSGDAIAGGVAVVHRDLKPDNFGIDSSRRLKLLDFGLAVALDVDNNNTDATYELTGATGSRRYMAPEVCRRDFYGTKVDVYSWAIAAFEVWSLAGKPYRRHDIKSHFAHVVNARERPAVPPVWNADLRGLLAEAWADDQTRRPPAGDAAGVLTRVDAMCQTAHADPLQGLPTSPVASLRKLWSFQRKKSADELPAAEKPSKRRFPKFF